ncbi:hypothetical protein PG994_008355 [Apiospora phragmitis]|uniref:Uncharacterized protein n=1 Tax=Apiospora phragmitis TaxID=2905665 RepID=A0ABR1USS7_9PEZI
MDKESFKSQLPPPEPPLSTSGPGCGKLLGSATSSVDDCTVGDAGTVMVVVRCLVTVICSVEPDSACVTCVVEVSGVKVTSGRGVSSGVGCARAASDDVDEVWAVVVVVVVLGCCSEDSSAEADATITVEVEAAADEDTSGYGYGSCSYSLLDDEYVISSCCAAVVMVVVVVFEGVGAGFGFFFDDGDIADGGNSTGSGLCCPDGRGLLLLVFLVSLAALGLRTHRALPG